MLYIQQHNADVNYLPLPFIRLESCEARGGHITADRVSPIQAEPRLAFPGGKERVGARHGFSVEAIGARIMSPVLPERSPISFYHSQPEL